ncbi:Bardet-Biedl syndrome 4 protein-like [Hondaea fermentalgiana]|uniref:Bardet-Biedl syndrome 4 protein-like n=1 Tax=Hondaea fermentalgiana TaxID=2315210 RepID=A0A2R5GN27_9STRA|nr:Bardet-Biedl syndrome 4 protein-like [Hondaea fermentalgiana]|eukprot:GBG29274.1 Bardet-Biedl syndrome 4 protein-like [Hondaea fermentalgiana]
MSAEAGTSATAKASQCKFYSRKGGCRFGDRCRFAHIDSDDPGSAEPSAPVSGSKSTPASEPVPPGVDPKAWRIMPPAIKNRILGDMRTSSTQSSAPPRPAGAKANKAGTSAPKSLSSPPHHTSQSSATAGANKSSPLQRSAVATPTSSSAARPEGIDAALWESMPQFLRDKILTELSNNKSAQSHGGAAKGTKPSNVDEGSKKTDKTPLSKKAPSVAQAPIDWTRGPFLPEATPVARVPGNALAYFAIDPVRAEIAICSLSSKPDKVNIYSSDEGNYQFTLTLPADGGPLTFDPKRGNLLVLLSNKGQIVYFARQGKKWVQDRAAIEMRVDISQCAEAIHMSRNPEFAGILIRLNKARAQELGMPPFLAYTPQGIVFLPESFENFQDICTIPGSDISVLATDKQIFARQAQTFREIPFLGKGMAPPSTLHLSVGPDGKIYALARWETTLETRVYWLTEEGRNMHVQISSRIIALEKPYFAVHSFEAGRDGVLFVCIIESPHASAKGGWKSQWKSHREIYRIDPHPAASKLQFSEAAGLIRRVCGDSVILRQSSSPLQDSQHAGNVGVANDLAPSGAWELCTIVKLGWILWAFRRRFLFRSIRLFAARADAFGSVFDFRASSTEVHAQSIMEQFGDQPIGQDANDAVSSVWSAPSETWKPAPFPSSPSQSVKVAISSTPKGKDGVQMKASGPAKVGTQIKTSKTWTRNLTRHSSSGAASNSEDAFVVQRAKPAHILKKEKKLDAARRAALAAEEAKKSLFASDDEDESEESEESEEEDENRKKKTSDHADGKESATKNAHASKESASKKGDEDAGKNGKASSTKNSKGTPKEAESNKGDLLKRKAEQLMKRRSYTAALAQFKEAIAETPGDFDLHYGAGQCALSMKQFEEAEEQFSVCVFLRDDNHKVHLSLGRIRMQQGHLSAAAESFDAAIRINPLAFESCASERRTLEQAMEKLERAKQLKEHGKLKKALSVAGEGLKLVPSCAELIQLQENVKVMKDDLDMSSMVTKIRSYVEAGDYPTAEDLMTKVMGRMSESSKAKATAEVWALAASIAVMQSNYELAIRQFEFAYQCDTDNQLRLKNFHDANQLLQAGIKMAETDQHSEALLNFVQALEKQPHSMPWFVSSIFLQMGESLHALGEREEARRAYSRAVESSPGNISVALAKIQYLERLGDSSSIFNAFLTARDAELHMQDHNDKRTLASRQRRLFDEYTRLRRLNDTDARAANHVDYYRVLGLNHARREASSKLIFDAFERKCMKLLKNHMHDEDEVSVRRHMIDLGEAFAVLSDPELREQYDRGTLFEEPFFEAGKASQRQDEMLKRLDKADPSAGWSAFKELLDRFEKDIDYCNEDLDYEYVYGDDPTPSDSYGADVSPASSQDGSQSLDLD